MEIFEKLGAEIEKLWREKNYNEEFLPEIAADALKQANLPAKVTAWEIIEWTLEQTHLPHQQDIGASFGEPPITLYNSPRFYIDIYYWLEGTTAIHQHSFCGAFQVLHGSSIHCWYDFERRERLNIYTEIGDLKLKSCELLNVGDVQEIWAGKRYIHSLFHLDQPSATIVVRTNNSPLEMPQYAYLKPYLAFYAFFEEPNTTRKLQCLLALFRSNHPESDKYVIDLLEKSDFQTTFSILSTIANYLHSNELDQLFNLDNSKNRFQTFLDTAKMRHGDRANIFAPIFEQRAKIDEIINRRKYVSDPEHRFFLALLMNIEGKERIFSLIKDRFPEAEPLDKVLDWTFELSQTRVVGVKTPNALGIAGFDDFDLFVLEHLLQDRSDEEIKEIFQREYPANNSEETMQKITEKSARIRTAAIFQPLFS